LSGSEDRSGASPAEKVEWLISEAKKVKAEIDAKTGPSDEKGRPGISEAEKRPAETSRTEKKTPVLDRSLKEEIHATLTETSEELSRIAGLLLEEKEAEREQGPLLPKYCCYCGRRLLPNAFYCDKCGARVKGV